MSFKVLDGSFGKGSGRLFGGIFQLPFARIQASTMVSADVATQENVKRLAGTIGWGALGGLALGPVGMLAGLLLGGKKTEVTFIVTFDDGRAFLGTSDPKTWAEIKGAAVRYASYRALTEHTHSVVEIASIENGSREPAASATAAERLEWSFAINN